ncbi:hypothetical protein CW748_02945 [Alteromonadales bacterium alter-6D02]|nr:hypothetical protein CW748_02945 [Alteromonadales bacterium alter-6D02]
MKYSILLLLVLSFGSYAESNRVLEFKWTSNETTDTNGKFTSSNYYSELTLENCNFQVRYNVDKKFEINISTSKYIADGYSVKKQDKGKCLLKLDNGQFFNS